VFEARIVKCGDRRLLCIVRDLTEIKRTEEELQLVSSRLLTLQDEERRKIARELHDVTAQNLFAITINLANLRQQIKHFTDAQLSIVVECENLCEQSLRDVRTLSYALHPPALDRLGLTPSVRWYIDTLNRRSGTNITLQAPNNLDRLPLQLETDIFRVIQEGLGNVARHSSSCTATVDLQQQSDQFVLCITENCRCCLTDNGSGSHNDGGVGVGLSSMQERLRRWGGHLHIQSGSDGVLLLGERADSGIGAMDVSTTSDAAESKPATILLADDHDVVRKGLRTMLEAQEKWVVCAEAATGHEAIRLAAQFQPKIAVLDLEMAEVSGLEATRQIRKQSPGTQVLIFTMHDTEYLIREVLLAGARAFVLKSEGGRMLIEAIHAALEDKSFFSGRASESLLNNLKGDQGSITEREREVIRLLAVGKTNKEVANIMAISVKTVETHRAKIMRKLELNSIAELVRYAVRQHLIKA
jgi:DNA-binding NarL/FixJ family response regulator